VTDWNAEFEEMRYLVNVILYAKGEAVGMNRLNADDYSGGTGYLGKDIMGSVRGIRNEYGQLEERYEYDAFGKPYKGDLNNGVGLGYTGKPYDTVTGMYNYGYRDYAPEVARFTTVDPIRDGTNWFAYVNNDPVNWIDPWGLSASDKIITTHDVNTITKQSGSVEKYYVSPVGPEQNGVKMTWAGVTLDTTNGSFISASTGIISAQGQTNTPVFVGGSFDFIDAGGYVAITNNGIGVSMSASAISLGGNIGASIGYQTGFELSFATTGIIIDVSFIVGARIELGWGKRE
jgi:RHS repeat-associated protein